MPRPILLTLRRTARILEPAIRKAEQEAAQEALRIARRLSSGPFTAAYLRRHGHPYSRRHGARPPADPAIINAQTGAFRAAWRVTNTRRTSRGLQTRLVNDSPY